MTTTPTKRTDSLERARALGLYGVVARWEEFENAAWLDLLLTAEEQERQRRSLERRLANARIGTFRTMADFDWSWPTKIERDEIEDVFKLQFLNETANVIFMGTNGLGKTMLAQNLAHQAILAGHTVLFLSASEMLNDLAAQDSTSSLQRKVRRYCRPRLLVIDELGYLSYDDRHADLLFEVVARRYAKKSTVVTTNKAFKEWSEVFPNASCVVALIDRLLHRAEVIRIEGESYRLKEANERSERKRKARRHARQRSPSRPPADKAK